MDGQKKPSVSRVKSSPEGNAVAPGVFAVRRPRGPGAMSRGGHSHVVKMRGGGGDSTGVEPMLSLHEVLGSVPSPSVK